MKNIKDFQKKNEPELDEEEIVADVLKDFEERRERRKPFELSWLLNINFVLGNQYSYISSKGEVSEVDKNFAWESREVFNHIAPIVESRLAKLGRVRPVLNVRPTGVEESDIETARISKMVLDSVAESLGFSKLLTTATLWSEIAGTSFYKVVWDWSKGQILQSIHKNNLNSAVDNTNNEKDVVRNSENRATNLTNSQSSLQNEQKDNRNFVFDTSKADNMQEHNLSELKKSDPYAAGEILDDEDVTDGDVSVVVVSPFEIFPDCSGCSEIDDCASIIHAKTIDASEAENLYGITAVGQTVDTLSFDLSNLGFYVAGESNVKKTISENKDNQVFVIERYSRPNSTYKKGRLEIVVGNKLVYVGDLPNGEYPFVKQVSTTSVGCFWGTSVIERCIPIQRSYNAIKNRKIEFLSRLSSGVLAVEDGSVDIDNLEVEGLAPGKILVYRSGSALPKFMDSGDIPNEFSIEEDRLLNEFISLTGVSELMRNSSLPNAVTSGTAINLLMEQDDTRLSVSAEHIRSALLSMSKKILKLYKKYATAPKLAKIVDNNGEIQIFYWQGATLTADDIVLDTSNELSETPATRKNMVLELLKSGVLLDENGKLDNRTKVKILDMLGFGNWEAGQDISSLQSRRAKAENLQENGIFCLEIDDHDIHITEHMRYILEQDGVIDENKLNLLLSHIRQHKLFKSKMISDEKI